MTNPQKKYLSAEINFFGELCTFEILNNFFSDSHTKHVDFDFELGTEAYFACTVIFNDETLILGGKREYNQVFPRFYKKSINSVPS